MQAVILATFGISALQYLKASPLQAARCSGVPWANPAEDEATRVARTAVPTRAVRSLVMAVSFGFRAAFSAAAVDRVAQTLVRANRTNDCDACHVCDNRLIGLGSFRLIG